MTVYRSKVDVWLVALSVGIMAAACVPGLFSDFSWGALTASLLSLALVVSVGINILKFLELTQTSRLKTSSIIVIPNRTGL